MMDYKALLEKYIAHVVAREGATFLHRCYERSFTPDEFAELRSLAGDKLEDPE